MSNVSALYHIVFCTKNRKSVLPLEHERVIYNYISSIVRNHKCHVHAVGGMPNHVHIVIDLHQDKSLSALLRELKSSVSRFIQNDPRFPKFEGWAKGYFAATMSLSHLSSVKNYVLTQRQHHGSTDFDAELTRLTAIHGMMMHPEDLM